MKTAYKLKSNKKIISNNLSVFILARSTVNVDSVKSLALQGTKPDIQPN